MPRVFFHQVIPARDPCPDSLRDSQMTESANIYESRVRQTQPLVVYGMHRSGTSLMVRLLADVGVHMGTWLSRDAEAVHFQRLNRRIYAAAGSDWATADGLLYRMRSEAFVTRQTELTRRRLFGNASFAGRRSAISGFFGRPLLDKIRQGGAVCWGWKDPRTSLTLPIWLRIFPHGRYLHVLRNGIDVAISVHRRSQKQQRKLRNRLFPLDYSPATLDFAYSFRLWETYVSAAQEHQHLVPPDQYLEMRYEDLLEEPEEQLRRVLAFLGHLTEDDDLRSACRQVDKGRLNNSRYAVGYQAQIRAPAGR